MYILGIWDGHDSGACIIEDGIVKVAINEERLTRKKLDIGFPYNAIKACLNYLNLKITDIEVIACCGTQLTRMIGRAMPSTDREFYNFRRRLIKKPRFEKRRRLLKYKLADSNPGFGKKIAEYQLNKRLKRMGFRNYKLFVVDHHLAHASSAAFCSGFKKSLCITLDGVGDGLSGSVSIFKDGEFEVLSKIPARDSLGILYEQVTTLSGFRELEDEGKIMCLADYSYPIEDSKNPMLDFYQVEGMTIKSKYSNARKFTELEKILWNTPREKFAYMAQKTLEKKMLELFRNSVNETGIKNVCWAGGVASNIKANRIVRLNSGLKDWFVFPHMGDGGLAIGAALYVSSIVAKTKTRKIDNVYFGPEFSDEEIENELKSQRLKYEYRKDVSKVAAELICKGNYLFWFQGRMELGPRALGNRSIIAAANSEEIKTRLNLEVKKREWFQPFCPSLLERDARIIFEDYDGKPDKFMTMGFVVRKKFYKDAQSAVHIDRSARPQMVGKENKKYSNLINHTRKKGVKVILNTSFNIHGQPIVFSPKDAIETMLKTKTKHMILGNYYVGLK